MDGVVNFTSIEKHIRPSYYKKQKNLDNKYVGLPPQSYFSLLKFIDDDYLTEWECLKMRSTFKTMWNLSFTLPLATFGVFWIGFPKMFNMFTYRPQFHRMFRIMFCSANTLCAWVLFNSFPFPNKQFHQVLTQPDPNGQYIRRIMRDNLPRQWGLISKELHRQGYNLTEMYEYDAALVMPEATNKFDNTYY